MKRPLELEFGLLEPEDIEWSKGVALREGTNNVVKLLSSAGDFVLIVSVKQLGPTVCQVVVAGQLAVNNSLSRALEVLISPDSVGQVQSCLTVQSGTTPPSVVLDQHHHYSLKLRFHGLSVFWSGEIPLTSANKWEVKIPLEEREQFRSIWCDIVWNTTDRIPQILVVLSPLYTIKSLLPCQANVVVETPAMSSTLTLPISGRGAVQPLDTPGLSAEMHNLTFQLEGKLPVSSPSVNLHYHILDVDPPPADTDISSILCQLQRPSTPDSWPYLGAHWQTVEWLISTQPDTVTDVKIGLSESIIATNALQVEVRPWALLVNTLGSHVYLQGQERTLCTLAHRTVISPPLLESTFQIGVELENRVELSNPIQLKKGLMFGMPNIPGLLPTTGFINTTVTSKNAVCFVNVVSSEVSSLRVIHVRSSFLVASLSTKDLVLVPLAIIPSTSPVDLPEETLSHPLVVCSQHISSKVMSQPVTEWRVLGEGLIDWVLYLVVGVEGVWSRPVRVPQGSERQSVEVVFPAAAEEAIQLLMTSEMVDGQTNLLLWDQPFPQLTVHNHTTHTVVFAKASGSGGADSDCEHLKWQLVLDPGEVAHYSFSPPKDAISPNSLPAAVIGLVSHRDTTTSPKWSEAISLTECSGRLLTLLGLPDVSLSVSKRGFTTHITLTTASHTEVLAVDIRGQLSKHLLDKRRASDESDGAKEEDPTVQEVSPPSIPPSENGGDRRGLDVSCYMHGLTVTLLSRSTQACECHEVTSVTLDYVGLTVHPHPNQVCTVNEIKAHLTVGDIQLDNQESGFDFPVVMMMQQSPEVKWLDVVLSRHAYVLVEHARSGGSAIDITVVADTSSHDRIAMQDVSVKLRPLQIYIEDRYIKHLKDYLMNMVPSFLFNEIQGKSSTKPNESAVKKSTPDPKHYDPQSSVEKESEDIVGKKEPSEGCEEEDLFNVSEPEDNQQEETMPLSRNSQERLSTPVYGQDAAWPASSKSPQQETQDSIMSTLTFNNCEGFPIAREVLWASQDLARPLRLRSLSISELDLLVSVHTSTRIYIALDHFPLQLGAFKRSSLFTTPYRLGLSLTDHYFYGTIYGTGWALGSLEMLGAPGGLVRSVGLGLKDFISLPVQGILQGPRAFLGGIANGSASLMQHLTAGTLTSVTRMASSWARTLDRLTLDQHDLEQSEQQRRLRPQTLREGVSQGAIALFISVIGGLGSIAHHPLQHLMSDRQQSSLANSIGMGIVGAVTRPLSGVANMVALTGEGLLSGVGWTETPKVRREPDTQHEHCGNNSRLKYQWKLLLPGEQLLLAVDATTDCYEAVTLLVTTSCLYVVNAELDIVSRTVKLAELRMAGVADDPTLVAFSIQPAHEQAHQLAQSRVVEFVKDSQRILIGELPDMAHPTESEDAQLQFFISPQVRNYLISVVRFATNHAVNRGFPVIS